MNEGEFKIQVLETLPQWRSGLWRRLKLDAAGLALFANPVFDAWLALSNWSGGIGDIVVDECGQIYWTALTAERAWSLFRYNPHTQETERRLDFGTGGKFAPQKMWLRRDLLWLHDRGEQHLLGLSRENFQPIYEIELRGDLIHHALDLAPQGDFYALVQQGEEKKICRYPMPLRGPGDCFTLKDWKEPVALAAGPTGLLYVLDAELGRFIRFDPASKQQVSIGALAEPLLKGFVPSLMEIDERGVIYLASDEAPDKSEKKEPPSAEKKKPSPAKLHLFDPDGSYLGETTRGEITSCDENQTGKTTRDGEITSWDGIRLPAHEGRKIQQIGGIGFDGHGGVYLATNLGLAKFSLTTTPVGQDGVYYSKTLDNGVHEGLWHRVALRGLLPDKTGVEVYYFASDAGDLQKAYDDVLKSDQSVEEKEAALERLMRPRWKGTKVFKGVAENPEAAPDLLPLENKGRYLWLKLRLLSFDGGARPTIRTARVYYQRQSYLRYLPPAYREDLVSAAFLERFLSLFETVFHGLELEIDQLYRHFDPRLAPEGFLRWLASWINLAVDEDLPVERVRQLITRAPELYGRKGTPAALQDFLEIYTGRPVSLTEHARGLKPMVLGSSGFQLGRGTLLLGAGLKGFRLGDTSVLGYTALRDKLRGGVRDADEPFLPLLRRFTISVDMERAEFERRAATLQRILDEQKPAHTAGAIRLLANQTFVLGVNATVIGTQPYQVGVTPLGAGYAVTKAPEALRLERGAWVGNPLGL